MTKFVLVTALVLSCAGEPEESDERSHVDEEADEVALSTTEPSAAALTMDPVARIYRNSDTLFSARFDNWSVAAKAFVNNLTPSRLVWHYTHGVSSLRTDDLASTEKSRVVEAFKPGSGAVPEESYDARPQCAVPVYVRRDDYPAADTHCVDLRGRLVQASWEEGWPNLVRGDVLKASYRNLQKRMVKASVKAGCRDFQQDGVEQNLGTLHHGGCFSSEGDAKFREYLRQIGQSPAPDFSISSHLVRLARQRMPNYSESTTSKQIIAALVREPASLLAEYRDFSAIETASYLKDLKSAAAEAGFPTSLSGNVYNPDSNYELYGALDLIETELSPYHRSARGIVELAAMGLRIGKPVISTLPSPDLKENRTTFALHYALGMKMILPFDVYVPDVISSNGERVAQPRFSADATTFGDLTTFIKKHATLLDGYEGLETYGYTSTARITQVSEDANHGRLILSHSQASVLRNIAAGSTVVIGGKSYKTVADTVVGRIYLDLRAKGDFLGFQGSNLSLDMISQPNGDQDLFSLPLNPGGALITKVRGARISYQQIASTEPKAGDLITIAGQSYRVLSRPASASVELDLRGENQRPRIGELITSITSKDGPGLGYEIPTADAPTVQRFDFNVTKPGYTSVVLNDGAKNISLGSVYRFAQTGLMATIDKFRSQVGIIYIEGNVTDQLYVGQPLVSLRKPGSSEQTFHQGSRGSIVFQGDTPNLVAAVRRKTGLPTVVHVVNLSDRPRALRMHVNHSSVFGRASGLTVCTLRNASGDTTSIIPRRTSQAGISEVSLPPLRIWGLLTCE